MHTLCVRDLIEAEAHFLLMQCFSYQIPTLGWDMIVLFAKDHHQFPFNVASSLKTVVLLALAQRMAVYIRGKVAYGGCDSPVEGASVG